MNTFNYMYMNWLLMKKYMYISSDHMTFQVSILASCQWVPEETFFSWKFREDNEKKVYNVDV